MKSRYVFSSWVLEKLVTLLLTIVHRCIYNLIMIFAYHRPWHSKIYLPETLVSKIHFRSRRCILIFQLWNSIFTIQKCFVYSIQTFFVANLFANIYNKCQTPMRSFPYTLCKPRIFYYKNKPITYVLHFITNLNVLFLLFWRNYQYNHWPLCEFYVRLRCS